MSRHCEDYIKDTQDTQAVSVLLHKNQNRGPIFGKRHTQSIMLAVLVLFSYITRSMLSVAIVAMTDPTASVNKEIPTFNWTDKGMILSSFAWGYCVPQFGAGYVADRYGAKWFLVFTTFITAIVGLLIPTVAINIGSKGLMASNLLQGICQGFMYPSVNGLLGKWVPSTESSRLGAFVNAAPALGLVVSMQLTGFMCQSFYGWPSVFYIVNGFLLLVAALYAYLGSSNPNCHPTISREEKVFITSSLCIAENRKKLLTPWKKILTSIPCWALLVTNISFAWMQWAQITQTSIYFKTVMNFDIKSNGITSSLPYILEFLIALIAGVMGDFVINTKILSTTTVRKIFNNIAFLISAICLFFLGKCGPGEEKLVTTLIILIGGSHAFIRAGFHVNYMDLSPNFSGIIMGLINGIGNTTGILAPLLLDIVVKDEKNVDQWRILFYISMSIMVVGAIINTLFTSGERQSWNRGL